MNTSQEDKNPAHRASDRKVRGPLHYASLTEVARLIEIGEISPVELTQLMMSRIAAIDGRLNSYISVMADYALATAHAAEREIRSGHYRGPLHGIPIAVKDLFYTKGAPTSGGHSFLSSFKPGYDATVVSRLAEAGAVLLGKLNMTEGAMGGYHIDFNIPVNPWREDLWPGVSSSGSGVATAAGLCYASLGTDTGGSIRFPTMANGIVGLKPTYGRVSRHGVLPLAKSLDHVGSMTRRVADAAIVLKAIAGFDSNDPTSMRAPVPDIFGGLKQGVTGVRIGFDRRYATEETDPMLSASIEAALAELELLGAHITEVKMPDFPDTIVNSWFAICAYEAHAAHQDHYPSRADEYGPHFREFLELGAAITDAQYKESSQLRAQFSERFRAVLSDVDAVVAPAGGTPFAASREAQYGGMADFAPIGSRMQFRFTMPADLAGTPTLSLSCGFSNEGLPYTFQFMGDQLTESMLCRIGHAYEEATEWHERNPDV